MKKIISLVFISLAFGCASHPDVRPGIDGINQISLRGEDVKDTENNSYKQARSYCKDQHKTAEFLSDESFKATPNEAVANKSLFKEKESVVTDIKFKCN
jgi:hypothetical protein